MPYDNQDADDESIDLSDIGSADTKLPTSLKQTKFSLTQFAKSMRQANNGAFNKWKIVWVDWFLEEKNWPSIQGQNCWYQVRDGPLHWEMVVAELLKTFLNWLPLNDFDNAQWIRRQWVASFLNQYRRKTQVVRRKGS